jgi:glycosyltransferase involved in cell wall biosynthesis
VLLVTREMPPAIGPHPIRVAKLAKYLPEFGWEVTILSVPVDHVVLRDDQLAAEIDGVPVVRVPRFLSRVAPPNSSADHATKRHPAGSGVPGPMARGTRARAADKLLWPDPGILWALPAARRAAALADQFDAVLTTAPPFSTHLVGDRLARRQGVPWVAEYRDNWTVNPLYRRIAPGQWVNRRLERRFLQAAGAVVAVSEAAAAEMGNAFPEVAARLYVAANGYDPDDLPPEAPRPTEFEIVYTGSLPLRRDLGPFFTALARLIEERPEFGQALRLRIVGWVRERWLEAAQAAIGPERVSFDGLVSHREALVRASRSAVLLGITTRGEAGGAGLTSKLSEYLGLRRPVLMLAPDGPARMLVEASGAGLVAEPDDTAAIAAAISRLFDEWRAGTERQADAETLRRLTRRDTARAVAEALDRAAATRPAAPRHPRQVQAG